MTRVYTVTEPEVFVFMCIKVITAHAFPRRLNRMALFIYYISCISLVNLPSRVVLRRSSSVLLKEIVKEELFLLLTPLSSSLAPTNLHYC